MAQYQIISIEERTDGDVACDTFVLKGEGPDEATIGHFTVILHADQVLAVADLPKGQRVQAYKDMFISDPRIQGVTDSEAAVAQMEADINFPIKVSF